MDDAKWDQLTATAPTTSFSGRVLRGVAQMSFDTSRRYLFTSGRRNRCNPEGILCLYMAEGRETALAEYDKYFTDEDDHQPCLLFTGELHAAAILDLGNPATVKHFGVTAADFFSAFRSRQDTTRLEALGAAVARQRKISAVRFPSKAMHVKHAVGFNFAIFPDAIRPPDSLSILGNGAAPLERWP